VAADPLIHTVRRRGSRGLGIVAGLAQRPGVPGLASGPCMGGGSGRGDGRAVDGLCLFGLRG